MKNKKKPAFPEIISIGDKYGPAMEINDQAEADIYFQACVEHCMIWEKSREEAEKIERQNLGYFAGYYDHETMSRVNRLFCTTHPIFGNTILTPEQTFQAGWDLAQNDN